MSVIDFRTHNASLPELLQLVVDHTLEGTVQAKSEGDLGGKEAVSHDLKVVVRDPKD